MTLHTVLFYFFAALAVVTAVLVVTRRNPVISALFLVVNFGALSGIYLLLAAQFIAVTQVIVYAGAIMVLFLFVIMLLKPENEEAFFKVDRKIKIFALVTGIVAFVQMLAIIFLGKPFMNATVDETQRITVGTIENIGTQLFKTYLVPFEAIAFVLLASAIGALVIAKKKFD